MTLRAVLVSSLVSVLVAAAFNHLPVTDWLHQLPLVSDDTLRLRSALTAAHDHVVSCVANASALCARWLSLAVDAVPPQYLPEGWRHAIRHLIGPTASDNSQSASPKRAAKSASGKSHKQQQQRRQQPGPDALLSVSELAEHRGAEGGSIYLALLGHVFDVTRGRRHYGPGGGYAGFAGRDASRAFISGDFSAEGLRDDVDDLSDSDLLGLEQWLQMYRRDYSSVGRLVGRYYDSDGRPTHHLRSYLQRVQEARKHKSLEEVEKRQFPPCNSEWRAADGGSGRVYCTERSGGGEPRDWVGVPRQLFTEGARRCACVRDSGPPSEGADTRANSGDLDNARLREYPGCHPKSVSCNFT